MATNNPVLSRSQTFSASYPAGFQPDAYYNPQAAYAPQGHQIPGAQFAGHDFQAAPQTGRMTIDDVIIKTAMLLLAVVAAGALTMVLLPVSMVSVVAIVGALVSFITVSIVSARRVLPVPGLFVYALVEGVSLGAFSKLFEYLYPGIVLPAVFGTVVAAGVVLATYKFLGARVNGRLGQIVTVSIIAYAVVSLINLVMVLFGAGVGLTAIGASAGPLAWLFSGIGVVLAAASLLQDFEAIENGVRNGAPESESWRGAFGLTVTMMWMYTNLLRILSYFRD